MSGIFAHVYTELTARFRLRCGPLSIAVFAYTLLVRAGGDALRSVQGKPAVLTPFLPCLAALRIFAGGPFDLDLDKFPRSGWCSWSRILGRTCCRIWLLCKSRRAKIRHAWP